MVRYGASLGLRQHGPCRGGHVTPCMTSNASFKRDARRACHATRLRPGASSQRRWASGRSPVGVGWSVPSAGRGSAMPDPRGVPTSSVGSRPLGSSDSAAEYPEPGWSPSIASPRRTRSMRRLSMTDTCGFLFYGASRRTYTDDGSIAPLGGVAHLARSPAPRPVRRTKRAEPMARSPRRYRGTLGHRLASRVPVACDAARVARARSVRTRPGIAR
jgi:hypothetical protein